MSGGRTRRRTPMGNGPRRRRKSKPKPAPTAAAKPAVLTSKPAKLFKLGEGMLDKDVLDKKDELLVIVPDQEPVAPVVPKKSEKIPQKKRAKVFERPANMPSIFYDRAVIMPQTISLSKYNPDWNL